jgi:hypothetical protein
VVFYKTNPRIDFLTLFLTKPTRTSFRTDSDIVKLLLPLLLWTCRWPHSVLTITRSCLQPFHHAVLILRSPVAPIATSSSRQWLSSGRMNAAWRISGITSVTDRCRRTFHTGGRRWPQTKCGDRCAIRSLYASSTSRKDNNGNANPTSVFGVKKTTSAARPEALPFHGR